MHKISLASLALALLIAAEHLYASVSVPEEYEVTGPYSLAFGGGSASALGGVAAVRANPALLALEKTYEISGSYHWPALGREFYQVGVVDGKTSSIAAGVSYASSLDDYRGVTEAIGDANGSYISKDSPAVRRGSLALASLVSRAYVGLSVSLIDAYAPVVALENNNSLRERGYTLGAGVAFHLAPELRIGLSTENLANKDIIFSAPTFYRAGISYFGGNLFSAHLDYRQRQIIGEFEGLTPDLLTQIDQNGDFHDAEQRVSAEVAITFYDISRLVAGGARTWARETSSTSAFGGVALVNKGFSLTYELMKPDLADSGVHHAISLGFDVAI